MDGRELEWDIVDLLVNPATKLKPRGRRGSSSWRGFLSFGYRGGSAADAMVPMCDKGFGASMGAVPPHRAGESEKGNTVKEAKRRRR
jgi:hypothetical protein